MTERAGLSLRESFISGMSHAACTVSIVTTDGSAGRAGVTVSAMSSVSADTPRPTLLICVHHQSPAAQKILENKVFCVNVLRDDQGYISDTFAGRFKDQVGDKFDCATWTGMPSGAPRVVDPLVGFDCSVVSSEKVGTHYVFFGEVSDVFTAGQGSPLIYARRAYGAATQIETAATIGIGQKAKRNALSVGCVRTFGPFILPEMIRRTGEIVPDLEVNLVEGDQRRVQESLLAGEVDLALMHALDASDDFDITVLTELAPYVLLAEGHPLADRAVLKPADLVDQPMILLNAPPYGDYFTNILRESGIEPRVALKSTSFEMVRGMVGHGLGYAPLATRPATSMSYDGRALISRPLNTAITPSQVVLASRKDAVLPKPADRFRSLCLEFFDL